jgi:tRNA nucleotidyltransferase (CCA-adding enzyme)
MVMDKVPVAPLLQEFSKFFTQNGYRVYLVGGAVRDKFLHKKEEDWDVATNATPEQVSSIFKRIIPTGIEHGTVTIPFRDKMIECTTFRTEEGFSDGRRPDSVSYALSIEEDLSRRDFTMNAVAVSLPDGTVIDPFSGRADIKAGIIRTVGNASERFSEDGLRPLRAVRFASQLGFEIEKTTLSAITPALKITARVAKERIRDELIKILCAAVPSKGLRFMEQTGLLELVLPELQACRGVDQKGKHAFDVLDHILLACDVCTPPSLVLRLAALLHDIGKPDARIVDGEGNCTFYNHEAFSAKKAAEIMERLRFPHKTIACVSHLVRQHMFNYEPSWTDAAVRRFIVRVGEESIDLLFALRVADAYAITGNSTDESILTEFRRRIDELIASNHAFSLKDLALNGNDLIAAGIKAGPKTGLILKELLDSVLDDPSLNTKKQLLDIAEAVYRKIEP